MPHEPLDLAVFDHHPHGVIRLRSVRGADGSIRDFTCTYANAAAGEHLAWPDLVGRLVVQELPAFDHRELVDSLVRTVHTGDPCQRTLPTGHEVTATKAGDGLLLLVLAPHSARPDADRRKDDFLATLAHELRNPLAPIRNAVQILKSKGPGDPTLVWGRDVIDRQVQHMARLLEDLLDVSRISRDKLELRKQPVELTSIIDVAIETSRPLIEASRHRLLVEVPPPGSVRVDADPVRLAQVFANLLNNAAKYTPEQGTIVLGAKVEDREVLVSVRDDGIGIAHAVLPHVFDVFSHVEPALGRAQGGLGIGLSLVKGIVHLHGGTVTAHSDGPDQGSEFTVRLPVLVDVPHQAAAGRDAAAAHVFRHRVLVVDDNVDGADSLAALLEIMGSEVRTAYDGETALGIAEAFEPTVVLLDIGMPEMNGYEVCRRLRAQPWGWRVFVVATTGWGRADDRQQTREAGFDYHLVKPVDSAVLLRLLSERVAQLQR